MPDVSQKFSLGRSSGSLHVALRSAPPGYVDCPPLPLHLLRVHAGPPARAQCKERSYRYTRGDIDIMPAGVSGFWHGHDPATTLEIGVPDVLLRRAAHELGRDPGRISVAQRHQVQDRRIEHVAWALEAEQRLGYPAGRAFADNLILALAYHMLGSYAADSVAPPRGLSRPQLQKLTDYIEAHLDRDLSLVQLARVLGMSTSHLKAQFKHSTGSSVHAYVMRQRVERARHLLGQTRAEPSQVALEAGFSHQSHMARWMRRLLGVTPSMLARR
ncbi:MAG: AraC family transcriptional regulator [Polyangiales bacterium]